MDFLNALVTLLNFAAEKEPSFYGLISERMLGIDTQTGFADAILNQGDFAALMTVPAARRAVALWQIGDDMHRRICNAVERHAGRWPDRHAAAQRIRRECTVRGGKSESRCHGVRSDPQRGHVQDIGSFMACFPPGNHRVRRRAPCDQLPDRALL